MPIIKWEPFRDIEKFFEEDFLFPSFSRIGWDLAVDVYEEGGNVVAEMNLPGVDPEKVEILIKDDHLKISGSRDEKKEIKGENYYRREIKRGNFERVVKLPTAVKADKAEAEYKDGILKVIIPKEEEKVGKVKIKVKK
jgi:HSP20 family protein